MEVLKVVNGWQRRVYERSTAQIIGGVIFIVLGICIIIIGLNSPQDPIEYLKKFINPYLYYSSHTLMGGFFIVPGVFLVIFGVVLKTKYAHWETL